MHQQTDEGITNALRVAIQNGRASYAAGDFKLALYYFQQALILSPTNPALYNNLGCIYQALNQLDEAVLHFKQAISYQPDDINAHTNFAYSLLKQGDFTTGWCEYEWRLKKPEVINKFANIFTIPKWTGEELDQKILLIIAEQGFGDTIQFCRYIPLIKKGNGKIIFVCRQPLVELMQTLSNCDEVQSLETAQGTADAHIFVMSLPFIFLNFAQPIPGQVPYLAANPAKIAKLPPYFLKNKLKVGFSWQVLAEKSTSKERSCSLELFLQLIHQFPQIQFFCLQRDIPHLEFTNYPNVINIADEIHDLADTAAMITQLDLVISIDTALVHLTGALNKPVWTLLPYVADWRWLLNRSDSPWYPSMRLYRQPDPGNWQALFIRVAKDLAQF